MGGKKGSELCICLSINEKLPRYFLKLLVSDLLIHCHCPKGWIECQEGFVCPALLFLGILDKEGFGGEHYVPRGI